ncbi:MAG: adenosylmethionine decarboxylase [Halobacteriovorax sp.]|nr:adenosylmethionine decarboxylase [Halobacteriovorax sp.]
MFFEGSEKKVEIVVKSNIDLLSVEESFWSALVKEAKATILSSIKNKNCKAYLLSESSLFVWSDRIVLITCGQTTLVEAIKFFLKSYPKEQLESLIFQRKNEYFSHLQKTSFLDDIELLEKEVTGKAYRFGKMHEHHNFMFCTDHPYDAPDEDITNELLMYDISGEASIILNKSHENTKQIRSFLKLETLFPDYQIDDFAFSPQGYSANAIRDEFYFTIHITPEEFNSYVSFETNEPLCKAKLAELLDILKPESFDLVTFNHEDSLEIPTNYHKRALVREKINLGYNVIFSHFYNKETVNDRALIFDHKEQR